MDINSGEEGQRELGREKRDEQESRLKESRECYKKMCVCVCEKNRLEEMEKQADKKPCGGERK